MKLSKCLLPIAAVSAVAAVCLGTGSRTAHGNVSGSGFVDPMEACVSQYNSLVTSAKTSLAGGDRNGAIRELLAARSQLGKCEEIHKNSSSSVSLGMNSGAALMLAPPPSC